MDIQYGYLFITDITGYTEFLTQSELDLKIFLHYGQCVLQQNGDRVDLQAFLSERYYERLYLV